MNSKAQKGTVVRCYDTVQGGSKDDPGTGVIVDEALGKALSYAGVTVSWLHYGCIGAALDGAF